jgi:hypothetical protein
MVPDSQYGPVFEADAVGLAFTVTEVVAVAVQLFASVTVTVYVPPFPLAERVGF